MVIFFFKYLRKISLMFVVAMCDLVRDVETKHGVQRRMISVVIFFRMFEIVFFCCVVAICDLVYAVEAMYGLP